MVGLASATLALVRRALDAVLAGPVRFWRLAGLRAVSRGRVPVTTQFDGPTRSHGRPMVDLGEHCRLGRDVFVETVGEGRIVLGDRVRLNAGCTLVSYASVVIGNDTLIGEYVTIRDADHGTEPGPPMRTQTHVSSPIRIGRDVWIARGSVVLKGVTIGDGAVIGANSVVTRDVGPGAIVAGAPARPIRTRGAPSAEPEPSGA